MFDITYTKNTQEFYFQKLNPSFLYDLYHGQISNEYQYIEKYLKVLQYKAYHKFHGSQFDNNSHAKFDFIGLYEIDMDVIHLLVLFEHRCHVHCLCTNVICMLVLFKHICCMSICVVHTWKLCTQFPCLNNAWHSCLNNMNLWSL
jgi:hypothetical protein